MVNQWLGWFNVLGCFAAVCMEIALQFVLHDTPLGQWAVDSVLCTPGLLKSILERQGGGLILSDSLMPNNSHPTFLELFLRSR
jgi:hypothetical protein